MLNGKCTVCGRVSSLQSFAIGKMGPICCLNGKYSVKRIFFLVFLVTDQTGARLKLEVADEEAVKLLNIDVRCKLRVFFITIFSVKYLQHML